MEKGIEMLVGIENEKDEKDDVSPMDVGETVTLSEVAVVIIMDVGESVTVSEEIVAITTVEVALSEVGELEGGGESNTLESTDTILDRRPPDSVSVEVALADEGGGVAIELGPSVSLADEGGGVGIELGASLSLTDEGGGVGLELGPSVSLADKGYRVVVLTLLGSSRELSVLAGDGLRGVGTVGRGGEKEMSD
ncbi:hypothetical protein BC835DRAFT_1422242 [Cytidiella melzeri]|nr:hypothetical protein BC835DRAFT_1422242 [Cytidiella melzeri]